jgi:hypothetical protein
MSDSFVYECALYVFLKGRGDYGPGREIIDVAKCRGEEAGNMLLRRTCSSAHNKCGALVDVHDDSHRCCLVLVTADIKEMLRSLA